MAQDKAEVQRRQTHCPQCQEHFAYGYPLTAQADSLLIIKVSCPFCETPLKINLQPHLIEPMIVYKGEAAPDLAYRELTLPDTLQAEYDQGA